MIASRTARVAVTTVLVALALAACQITITPILPDEPDLVVTAQGLTTDPVDLGSLRVPAGAERWVEVNYRSAAGADLMFFEIAGSGVEGNVRIELRSSIGQLIVASTSSQLFATNVARLGGERFVVGAAEVEPRSIGSAWRCLGPCVAQQYRSGRFYAKLVNTSSVDRTVTVYAFGIEATDENEPNETAAEATPVTLTRDGDGVVGAIERVGDVDFFRFECASGFGRALRLELVSEFRGDIVLAAGGGIYRPGDVSAPLPCGSVVHVRTEDSTAGPSDASRYALLAQPTTLYELTVTAQALTTSPASLGSMRVPAGDTRWVRVTFPPAGGAELRYVEVGGSGVDGNVRLESFEAGDLVGVSESRDLFAASTTALVAPADTLDPSSVSVNWRCMGPCVAERYRSGVVELRVTNRSSSARTVDVYAYGAVEADDNEPNDNEANATVVTLTAAGDGTSGAIERIGDVDYFRFQCGSGWPQDDITLRMTSGFAGGIVLRLADGSTYDPGATSRAIPCNSLVSVRTTDGTAGPSDASRYAIVAD